MTVALLCESCGATEGVERYLTEDGPLLCWDCRRRALEARSAGSAGESAVNGVGPAGEPKARRSVTASEFVALKRRPIRPYVATSDGRSVLFAQSATLLIGGPSGVAKSLTLLDLLGKLSDDEPSLWLGLRVCGGLSVLLVVYDGEGSDEDVAERVGLLIPPGAQTRLHVWDRWRLGPAPRADDAGIAALAAEAKRVKADVIALDTAPAFFSGGYEISKGIPEQAHRALEQVRTLAGARLSFSLSAHTRKKDTRAAKALDELEELAGTFVKKTDGAIVIRRDGEDRGPRRRVTIAKVRRGPEIEPVIATLPTDHDAPPRLSIVADLGGAHVKDGTEAEAMAKWIRAHEEPVAATVVRVRFDLSETTMRRRKDEMAPLGVICERKPGAGNGRWYGTDEQWSRVVGVLAEPAGERS